MVNCTIAQFCKPSQQAPPSDYVPLSRFSPERRSSGTRCAIQAVSTCQLSVGIVPFGLQGQTDSRLCISHILRSSGGLPGHWALGILHWCALCICQAEGGWWSLSRCNCRAAMEAASFARLGPLCVNVGLSAARSILSPCRLSRQTAKGSYKTEIDSKRRGSEPTWLRRMGFTFPLTW